MASTITNLDQSKKLTKTRKPSIPVRQTKTSKIRSELGNKLEYLKNELQKLKECESIASSRSDLASSKDSLKTETFKKPANISRKTVVSRSSEVISRTNSGLKTNKISLKSPPRTIKNNPIKLAQSDSKLNPKKQPIYYNNKNKTNVKATLNKTTQPQPVSKSQSTLNKTTQPPTVPKPAQRNIPPKVEIIKHLKPTLKSRQSAIKNEKKTVKIESPLRKSISAMHLKRVSIRDPTIAIYRSFSAVNVSQTINENETLQIPNFNTPMSKRRSVYNSTPMTIGKKKNLSPWSGCWSPTAQDLKRRLSVWIEKCGKQYNEFNHLRCFGLHYDPSQEENKENVKVDIPNADGSYEDLKIKINDSDKSEDILAAYDAISDLRKLISQGYPVDQCDAWLDVIRTRFEEIEDTQQYWECMAAIEELRGKSNSFYQKDDNETYIDNLLQKFNVLNLTPTSCKQKRSNFHVSEIFNSTAISFAVKECPKNEDTQYLVTPIKRSTRRSTANKITPGIVVCSTLDELDSSVRNSMRFRTNKALKK